MRHLHCIENKATQQSTLLSILVRHGESMEPADLFTLLELASELSSDVSGDLIELSSTGLIESANTQLAKSKVTIEVATPLNSFAARLRLAIAHSGMTQAALAWGIGVSQSTISSLVTGKSKEAGIVRARAIAETLEVNAQWLLYGEGDMCSKQSESFESQAARIKFSGHNS